MMGECFMTTRFSDRMPRAWAGPAPDIVLLANAASASAILLPCDSPGIAYWRTK